MPAEETETNLSAELSRFDDAWSRASSSNDDTMYADIPDGNYEARIEEARVTETAATGRPMVVWTLRIQGSASANRTLTKTRVITENTIGWLKEDLRKCGLNLERLSTLPKQIHGIEGLVLPVEKRTKDGRANIYFRWPQRKLPAAVEDELPF